jgi:hypothetical protein
MDTLEGLNLLIFCALKIMSSSLVAGDAKDKDISWFSPNGEKLSPNQQRISVVWNDDDSSTLTIYNANIDDAGIYKCVVTAEDGTQSEATVNVKIFRKSPHVYPALPPLLGRYMGGQ